MAEINLLNQYPKSKRNLRYRSSATEEDKNIARQFGFDYFDGDRKRGYGGYHYDGRWLPIARTIVEHWGLKSGDSVLDIGCGKGFLVKDLMLACPGLQVFGVDISEYAVTHCEPELVGRIHVGNCLSLAFPDKSFTAVISINTIHNLERECVPEAIKELIRVSQKFQFIQVDAYRSPEELVLLEQWLLTAKTYLYPHDWEAMLKQVGYGGDYFWTILSSDDVE